ncbi:MAG: TlpA disulfide reductase family protein [Candidatus Marinimicrobia bacterium]|nr:TlpA disulfide reductase family protein [Candidatus Neomarinimicrobiota bacterium]MDP7336650.1 TlpA disulfide reductase family protein [Candidatus Neomarinimicrobiota bacterium]MDP7475252.1 TlpA disulfide reductase family protein [Candidatus Neomarinimicrobiota bacterium]
MINFLPWIRKTCIVAAILIFSSGLGVGQEQDTTVSDTLAGEKAELMIGDIAPLGVEQEQDTTVSDTLAEEKAELMIGDIAPSWALMIGPAEYEFLQNWTVKKGTKLRKPKTQPDRHVVILSFFATWCKPCMKELPHLQNLYEKYMDQKIKFFLIDITEATRTVKGNEDVPEAGPFLTKKGLTMPILYDPQGIAMKRYKSSALPRLFVIDKYRTLRMLKKGFKENEDFEGELSEIIDQLLAEK